MTDNPYTITVTPPVVPTVTIEVALDDLRDLRLALSKTNWFQLEEPFAGNVNRFAVAVDTILAAHGMSV